MSEHVRDVLILSGLLALYGLALWLYEEKLAGQFAESFATDPRAIFARGQRDQLMAEELGITSDTEAIDA